MNSSLNHIYSVVWNASLGLWQVVSEVVRRGGKTQSEQRKNRRLKIGAAAVAGAFASLSIPSVAFAQLPTGGQVVGGQASIVQSGNVLNITQGTDRAAIDWQTFNVGQGNSVNFVQPTDSSIALNRVLGSDVSVIQGAVNANGQVFLVNQNGILFTPTAQVNVGGIVASTQNISTADFMAGKYTFSGNSTGSVENQGNITTANGGTVALIAAKIINTGTITAPQGTVGFAAGNTVTLDFGGPVKIQVTEGALNTLIEQNGGIVADGGRIYLTAKAAGELAASAINHTGITRARTLAQGQTGEIILLADMGVGTTTVAGTLDASAPTGGNGGFIETSAAKVKIQDGMNITSDSTQGKTGTWLIDPTDYTIAVSGGDMTGAALSTALQANNVTIQTTDGTTGTNGDLFVNDAVSWSAANTLTLNALRHIDINADITASNANGKLALEYGQATINGANSNYFIAAGKKVSLQAGLNFSLKSGSSGTTNVYTVITNLGNASDTNTNNSLQGISSTGRFALGANIEASSTSGWNSGQGFRPIANFSGQFEGLGNQINNLRINRSGSAQVGLFSTLLNGAVVSHLGITGAQVTGATLTGVLVGSQLGGLVRNSYSQGMVTCSQIQCGGLVGIMSNGSLSSVYSSVTVSADDSAGGLVGELRGGNISNSYATGNISTNNGGTGGLVGFFDGGSISNSYATGQATSPTSLNGGLVGLRSAGTITASFWDTQTSGTTIGVGDNGDQTGVTGKTTADMQKLATFSGAGWNISGSNGTYPMLTFRSGAAWKIGLDTTPIFIRLDCGLCESIYGETPQFSFKAFNMASGGTEIGDATLAGTALYSLTSGGMAAGTELGRLTDAGTYAVTYTSGLTGNSIYSLSAGAATNFTIKPKLLTVAIQAALGSPLSKVYDGNENFTLKAENFTIIGFVDQQGTGASINQTAATFNNSNVAQANLLTTTVGSSNLVVAEGVKASNYSLPSTTLTAAGTITPKALAITTNDFVSSPLTTAAIASTTGLVNNQTVSAVNVNGKNVSLTFGENTLASNYATTLVVPGAAGSDLNVNRDLTLAEGLNLTMRADNNININSVIDATAGTGGKVTLEYGQGAVAANNAAEYILKLTNEGFEGKVHLDAGQNFATKLGSDGELMGFTVITELGMQGVKNNRRDLQGISGDATGLYVLGADIDASATATWNNGLGFEPITGSLGQRSGPFQGTFDGLGHRVNNLFINRSGELGLFSATRIAQLRHLGLEGGQISGGTNAGSLVGSAQGGLIRHVYAKTPVGVASIAGGLVGVLRDGQIRNAFSTGSVVGASVGGGLVGGINGGNSSITKSYATGAVKSTVSGGNAGGLVGSTTGAITLSDVFATGAVEAAGTAGGLLGINSANTTINRAFATGKVTGATAAGGLIGAAGNGVTTGATVTASFWNTETSGLTNAVGTGSIGTGATGKTTAQLNSPLTYIDAGWDFANVWGISRDATAGSGIQLRDFSQNFFDNYIAIGDASKTYGEANTSITGATLRGIGVANVTLSFGSAIGQLTDAGEYAYSSPNVVTVTTNVAGQNTFVDTSTGKLTINKKALTVRLQSSTANPLSKVYDGNTTLALGSGNFALSGFVGEQGTGAVLNGVTSGTFNNANVLQANTVSVNVGEGTLVLAEGAKASNYSLPTTAITAAGTITAKALTIAGTTVADKTYDGNTTASVTVGTLSGLVQGETLGTTTATGTFADKDAGDGKNVTVAYTLVDGVGTTTPPRTIQTPNLCPNAPCTPAFITITIPGTTTPGAQASNYTLAAETKTAKINPKALTINGTTVANKTYDGNQTASVTVGTLSGLVEGETLGTTTATGTFADKNAGKGKDVAVAYTLTNGTNEAHKAGNYSLAGETKQADIAQKQITVIDFAAGNKTYDGNRTATITNTGKLNGVIESDAAKVALGNTGATFDTKNAGTGKTVTLNGTSLSGDEAKNYVLADEAVTAKADIAKRDITVSGIAAGDKTYDGNTNATITNKGTLSNLVQGETLTVNTVGSFDNKDAGERNVNTTTFIANGNDEISLATNYNLTNATNSVNAKINQKALTVAGTVVSNKTYDGNTTATVVVGTLSGFVAGENPGSVTGVGTFASKDVARDSSGNVIAQNVAVAYTLADGQTQVREVECRPECGPGEATPGSGGRTKLITVEGAKASNYTLAAETKTATINAKALTVNGTTVDNKTYDGNRNATVKVGTLSGLIEGETLGATTATGTFADQDAGLNKNVAVAYTLSNGINATHKASNYSVAEQTLQATINQRALTIAGTTVADKTYDGNTAASVTVGTLNGLLKGETLGTTTATGTFASKDVVRDSQGNALAQNVQVAYTLADGVAQGDVPAAKASNYTLAAETKTAKINPKALTITGTTVANKTYDGNQTASVTVGTLSGLVEGETLGTTTATGTFADKNAGKGKNVAVAYTLANGTNEAHKAGNYSLAGETKQADIAQKQITVTEFAVANKTYDGNRTATIINTGKLNGVIEADTAKVALGNTGATFDTKNAGTGKTVTLNGTSLSGDEAKNYVLANEAVTAKADIAKKDISLVGFDAANKVYDGNITAQIVNAGALSGVVQDDKVIVSNKGATFDNKDVGSAKTVTLNEVTISGDDAGNYNIAGTATDTANITQRQITVTDFAVANKTYDGNTTATITNAGKLNGVIEADAAKVALGNTGATFDTKNAGTGKTVTLNGTSLSGDEAKNYVLANDAVTAKADIAKRDITVSGIAASDKTYDGNTSAVVTNKGTLSNLVQGETLTVNTVGSFDSKDAGERKVSTTTTIGNGANDGGLASNYNLTNAGNTVNAKINQKALTIAGTTVANKTYDGNQTASVTVGTLDGLVEGETLGTTTATGTYADRNAGKGKNVAVAYTLSNGSNETHLASNYSLAGETKQADIEQKRIAVAGFDAANKVYDGTNVAQIVNAGMLTGVIGDDTVSVSNSGATFDNKNAGTEKTVTLNGVTIAGKDAGNYSIADTATDTADIAKRDGVVISADAQSKVVGSADPRLTFVVTGLLEGDAIEGSLVRQPGEAAGLYAITQGSADNSNYNIQFNSADLTITQPVADVAIANANRIATQELQPSLGERREPVPEQSNTAQSFFVTPDQARATGPAQVVVVDGGIRLPGVGNDEQQ